VPQRAGADQVALVRAGPADLEVQARRQQAVLLDAEAVVRDHAASAVRCRT
jgi:hypothetical protein